MDTGLAERMLQWRHSGFTVHNRNRSKTADAKAGNILPVIWLAVCPFALENMVARG